MFRCPLEHTPLIPVHGGVGTRTELKDTKRELLIEAIVRSGVIKADMFC